MCHMESDPSFRNVMNTFSKRNLECAQKSAENKGIANFTVKAILFQTHKILFGKTLIFAQRIE